MKNMQHDPKEGKRIDLPIVQISEKQIVSCGNQLLNNYTNILVCMHGGVEIKRDKMKCTSRRDLEFYLKK